MADDLGDLACDPELAWMGFGFEVGKLVQLRRSLPADSSVEPLFRQIEDRTDGDLAGMLIAAVLTLAEVLEVPDAG